MNTCRKSVSMESIPSIQYNNPPYPPHYVKNQHTSHNYPVVNVHNKYGTVSGYSTSSSSNNANNNNYHTRPSVLTLNQEQTPQPQQQVYQQQQQNDQSNPAITNNNSNLISSAAEAAAQALANSRLRSINRSFRTAVDKSFDMPLNNANGGKCR